MKINVNCGELTRDLKDLTCDKCGAEPWQCLDCEITAEIKEVIKNSIKEISVEL